MKEEYVRILDYLPNGYAGDRRAEPVIQSIGEDHFTLLELVPKNNVDISLEDRLYVGAEKREKIKVIKKRLRYDELTNMSKSNLLETIKKIIKDKEKKFVELFNNAGSITPRMHKLELLPGFGKKHVLYILDERRKKPFESFKDIKTRIHLLPDLYDAIANRILDELKDQNKKYYLFVGR